MVPKGVVVDESYVIPKCVRGDEVEGWNETMIQIYAADTHAKTNETQFRSMTSNVFLFTREIATKTEGAKTDCQENHPSLGEVELPATFSGGRCDKDILQHAQDLTITFSLILKTVQPP